SASFVARCGRARTEVNECHEAGGLPPGHACWCWPGRVGRRPVVMVHVGLDLSRTRLDVHVMDESGAPLAVTTALPEAGGLAALVSRIGAEFSGPVYAAIESMNGARFVHDQLELAGWRVEIADAQNVKGLAPLACKAD